MDFCFTEIMLPVLLLIAISKFVTQPFTFQEENSHPEEKTDSRMDEADAGAATKNDDTEAAVEKDVKDEPAPMEDDKPELPDAKEEVKEEEKMEEEDEPEEDEPEEDEDKEPPGQPILDICGVFAKSIRSKVAC